MEKVIYLFGAGASAGPANSKNGFSDRSTIPLVGELVLRMNEQIERLESIFRPKENEKITEDSEIILKSLLDQYEIDLKILAKNTSLHYSIDTYARKLYLSYEDKRNDIKLLKATFSTFLIIEHILQGVDVRYDAFFSAIMVKDTEFASIPSNFNFFSWNYDYQFEQSLFRIIEPSEL